MYFTCVIVNYLGFPIVHVSDLNKLFPIQYFFPDNFTLEYKDLSFRYFLL